MPRTPKDPSLLARRNKVSTRATLHLVDDEDVEIPAMPGETRDDVPGRLVDVLVDGEYTQVFRPWHPMAVEFWCEVWSSPMAAEYLDADVPGLHVLLALTDSYWSGVDQGKAMKDLAGEIRLQRVDYGLTPIARRRLQWEVERADEAQHKGDSRRRRSEAPKPQPEASQDPRLALVE
jgi:hypothetical protein